jgi:hypothetical protein
MEEMKEKLTVFTLCSSTLCITLMQQTACFRWLKQQAESVLA